MGASHSQSVTAELVLTSSTKTENRSLPDTVTTSSLGKPNIRLSVSKTISTELAAS